MSTQSSNKGSNESRKEDLMGEVLFYFFFSLLLNSVGDLLDGKMLIKYICYSLIKVPLLTNLSIK